jgi:sialic acid synthase SpsE
MVRAAARAGADYIKFQTFEPKALVTSRAPKAAYQIRTTGRAEGQQAMLERLVLRREQFVALQKLCRAEGIGFLSTAFDSESLAFVEGLRPDFHKISSGDINNFPLLRQAARYRRPLVLSTGMATLQEIHAALRVLEKAGLPRRKITVLQCHTSYPTRLADVNLRVIDTIRKRCRVRVGLSDHTLGIFTSLAAVARGASIIEKHFTLSRSMKGPDHQASLLPAELAELARGIREIQEALGSPVKKPSPREIRIRKQARKYLVAKTFIRLGERFSPENLGLKRSGGGIPASRWDQWLGKVAQRNYSPDDVIRP